MNKELCKALLIGRDAKGNIVYAINLWHEQARIRDIEFSAKLKQQKAEAKTKRVEKLR